MALDRIPRGPQESKTTPATRGLLKVLALTTIIAGQSGYLLIWLAIRAWGEVTLTFGTWGPSWVLWFEHWIEPLIILMGMAFVALILWREFNPRGAARGLRSRTRQTPGP